MCLSCPVAPVCSISGRPACFYRLFEPTLSRAAHPGAAIPSDFPGSHNILWVFLLATQLCYLLFSSHLKAGSYL